MKPNPYVAPMGSLKKKGAAVFGRDALDFARVAHATHYALPAAVISLTCFDDFIVEHDLVDNITEALSEVHPFDKDSAENASQKITQLFTTISFSTIMRKHLEAAYFSLLEMFSTKALTVEFSHTIEARFLTEKTLLHDAVFVDSVDTFLDVIIMHWKQLFSTEDIERRANGYYDGNLGAALLVKKAMRSDISGRAFSIPPITKQPDTLEIQVVYGLVRNGQQLEEEGDTYVVGIDPLHIEEKHIVPQEAMMVRSTQSQIVPISPAWRKRQKIDDDRIMVIAQAVLDIEDSLHQPVEVQFGFDGGNLFVSDVRILSLDTLLNPEATKDEEAYEKLFDTKSKRGKVKNQEKNTSSPDIAALQKEIQRAIAHDDVLLAERTPGSSDASLFDHERDRSYVAYPKWSEHYNLITDMYLDISRLHVQNLASIMLFNGTYFDGTEILLHEKKLPEQLKTVKEQKSLVDTIAIELLTASKSTGPEPLLYQCSYITDYEYKLLETPESLRDTTGDDRLLTRERAFSIELQGIVKARKEYGCTNVHIVLPGVRTQQMVLNLKKIVSQAEIRRSRSLRLYAEVSVPSFVLAYNALDNSVLDGVIISFDTLLKRMVHRDTLRQDDYGLLAPQLESFVQYLRDHELEIIVAVGTFDPKIIEHIFALQPHGIICKRMPPEGFMEQLQKQEVQYIDKKKLFVKM